MANETMTVNRLPALTWNWLKMNAARLEANAPAVGAAPSFVQTAQLARSSAAQDWAMETGMGTDVDRFLANSPAAPAGRRGCIWQSGHPGGRYRPGSIPRWKSGRFR